MVLSRELLDLIYNFENTTLAVVWRIDFERERVKAGRVLRAFFSPPSKRWGWLCVEVIGLGLFSDSGEKLTC